jgi:hypothetical protein
LLLLLFEALEQQSTEVLNNQVAEAPNYLLLL